MKNKHLQLSLIELKIVIICNIIGIAVVLLKLAVIIL